MNIKSDDSNVNFKTISNNNNKTKKYIPFDKFSGVVFGNKNYAKSKT